MNLIEFNRLLLELVDLDIWSEHLAVLLREQRTDAGSRHCPDY
ncbi:hypothetical protein [Dactylosporangium sp. NPDC049140]|jgi:hypothetical protein